MDIITHVISFFKRLLDGPTKKERTSKPEVRIAVMGISGVGKSTFIKLLTNDDKIRVGYSLESETSDIQTAEYIDKKTGYSVTLIDTPGFDDNREGVTDADILQKVADFLEPVANEAASSGRVLLNGIIYMHRISDARFSRISMKNVKIFELLCGKGNLGNVRIVTTNWSRVTEQEGRAREEELRANFFKPLIDAGAKMRRHGSVESAQQIISEFIPLKTVLTLLQDELQREKTLQGTSAGSAIAADIQEMQKKLGKEISKLKEELAEAEEAQDDALKTELAGTIQSLEKKLMRAPEDLQTLQSRCR